MNFRKYLTEADDSIIESLTHWSVIEYNNKLIEMFDEKHKINISADSNKTFQTYFYINDTKYYFHCTQMKKGGWVIQFYSNIINDRLHGNMKGKEYIGEVFGAIFQSLRLLINKHNVDIIAFTAEDNDLYSLYKKMTPWIIKRFPDYDIDKQYLNKKEFIFKRKGYYE